MFLDCLHTLYKRTSRKGRQGRQVSLRGTSFKGEAFEAKKELKTLFDKKQHMYDFVKTTLKRLES